MLAPSDPPIRSNASYESEVASLWWKLPWSPWKGEAARDDRHKRVEKLTRASRLPWPSLNITYLFAGTSDRLGIRGGVAIPPGRPSCRSFSSRSWQNADLREGSGPTSPVVLISASTDRISWSTLRPSGTDA